jgi:hypothetical protein
MGRSSWLWRPVTCSASISASAGWATNFTFLVKLADPCRRGPSVAWRLGGRSMSWAGVNRVGIKTVRFSFWQIQIYDRSVSLPACIWTPAHVQQGFARRTSTASFATLFDAGDASVALCLSPLSRKSQYDRVVCVPFYAPSGAIGLGAPDDWPHAASFTIEPGHYRLCAAQKRLTEDSEAIDLFFERVTKPVSKSVIVVCDGHLKPPNVLLEDSPES